MKIRTRKLIGTVALLVLVIVWALLAMGFAQMLSLAHNRFLEIIYYIAAGIGWVVPAMPLIAWMSRPDEAGPAPEDE
jgi:predicted membrane channel-forming protein YqfA (hemolysin III family)